MKRRKFGSILLILSLILGLMQPVWATDDLAVGLTVVEGSNGTLVASDEQLATITLENSSQEDITIHLVNLGEESDVTIAAGDTYTFSAPDIYDENGDAYKLALTGKDPDVIQEYPIMEGLALSQDLEITLTLIHGVLDYYVSHGQETARWLSCFVYADENGVDPTRSILSGVMGDVKAGDTELSDISMVSHADNTGGIRAGGSGTLTVTGADIKLYGNGGDDFTGIGAALAVADTATLNVTNANVYTSGILRSAIFAGDEATMNLDASTLVCEPGEYQADVSIPSAGMASPPNGLGIWGNCRAMNMVDAATINITNCEITSQDWGALGVDDVTDGHLTVKDSIIHITDQGYGAYSIGKCVDVFEHCEFDIGYGVIGFAAAGDGAEMILSGGSQAISRNYYGFVTHQSFNGTNSKITVTGEGTTLDTKLGGIIAKGRGADIEISDGATVTAESGVLVRAQINDDTGAGTMDGTETVNVTVKNTTLQGDIIQGMGAPYESDDTASDVAMGDMGGMTEGNPAEMGENPAEMGEMPMGEGGPGGPGGPGGMGSSAKTESVMNVTLENAQLEGAISSAELTLAISDGNISFDNITDVGVVTDTTLTYNEFANLNLTLTENAQWTVTEPCYLMSLSLEEGSSITALPGYLVTMTVDGVETPLTAGEYTGEILLDVVVDENYVEETPEEVSLQEPEVQPEPTPEETDAPTQEVEDAPAETGSGSSTVIVVVVVILVVVLAAVLVILKKKKK